MPSAPGSAGPSSGPVCPVAVPPNDCVGWLGKDPTADEHELVQWVKKRKSPTRILHVGVGNALFSREFGSRVVQGISKDGGEVAHSRQFGLEVILCNKYDVMAYARSLLRPFDCIVDVNIRSYACCDVHFNDYMHLMLESLTPGGMLLTSLRGLDYLIPTPLRVLKSLCPDWTIQKEGNVVIMLPRFLVRLQKWREQWGLFSQRTPPHSDGARL